MSSERAANTESGGKISRVRGESSAAAVIADQRGLITYVNDAFVALFGWQREEIVGLALTTIVPPALRDAHNLGFSRFLATGTPTLLDRPLPLRAIDKRGRTFVATHLIVAEQHDGKWVFGATITPAPE